MASKDKSPDTGSSRPKSEYTVAVIFALEFEMSAFRYMLDEEHATEPIGRQPGDSNEYILGKVGQHNVVLATLPGIPGIGAAALVAANMSRTFEAIEWRLLVGIGGGVPSASHDIRLGDVVISMPDRQYGGVGDYSLGRDSADEFQPRGFIHAPPAYLRSVAGRMQSDHRASANKIELFVDAMRRRSSKLQRTYQRPAPEHDVLFPDDYVHETQGRSCHKCDTSRAISREPRDPEAMVEIHYGLIASGNSLVVSPESRREKISRLGAEVLCFEMEAAGIMSGYECLVIRGISDYADSHKGRAWRHYAAATAAACAKEFLLLARPTVRPARGRSSSGGGSSGGDGGGGNAGSGGKGKAGDGAGHSGGEGRSGGGGEGSGGYGRGGRSQYFPKLMPDSTMLQHSLPSEASGGGTGSSSLMERWLQEPASRVEAMLLNSHEEEVRKEAEPESRRRKKQERK